MFYSCSVNFWQRFQIKLTSFSNVVNEVAQNKRQKYWTDIIDWTKITVEYCSIE